MATTKETKQIRTALLKAYLLIDSVAYVAKEGDKGPALDSITEALDSLDFIEDHFLQKRD